MNMQPGRPKKYQVRVGHSEVHVEADSQEDAIRRARQELKKEMPRLYDVLHRMEDAQFLVIDES